MPKPQDQQNDFRPEDYTSRVESLEAFKDSFEGVHFYEKVADALSKSKDVEREVKKIAWETIKSKIVWLILGGLAIIFTDLILKAIPALISRLS